MRASRSTALTGVALLLLAACAHGGRGDREAPPPESRDASPGTPVGDAEDAVTPGEPAPREIDRDRSVAEDPGARTPQRRASLRVVEEGKGYLIAHQPAAAAGRFSQATRIDPTNGFAYYWLGRARIAQGDARGAVGVLEKAESLLGPYPEWRDAAAGLLASLGAR